MVKVESQADALVVTLNRPDIHNAFNEHVIAHLTDIFTNEVPRASSAKCVVLTGTGKSFSAGADLAWMQKMVAYSKAENLHDSHRLFDMFHAIYNCPLPVIGRINGAGLGGGAGLVATCDIAIASHEALFGFTEVQLGLIPAVISPFVVRKIGASAASRYFLTGERFDAATAKSIGLVQQVCQTTEELDAAVAGVVQQIAKAGPQAVRLCKTLLHNIEGKTDQPLAVKEYVCDTIASVRVSQEAQQRLNKFLAASQRASTPKK